MYNPNIHNRKSIRLAEHDYSSEGMYFITICTEGRKPILGEVINDQMVLNVFGNMVNNEWKKISKKYNNIKLGEFIIMPNHIHGILQIKKNVGAPLVGAQNTNMLHVLQKGQPQGIAPTCETIGNIIGGYKSITTNQYIYGVKKNIFPNFTKRIWQRNFYEHVIRNVKSLQNIENYIINNPRNWKNDKFYV